jgi:hypothetical protein
MRSEVQNLTPASVQRLSMGEDWEMLSGIYFDIPMALSQRA